MLLALLYFIVYQHSLLFLVNLFTHFGVALKTGNVNTVHSALHCDIRMRSRVGVGVF